MVPKLTRCDDIKLNERLWLRAHRRSLSICEPDISLRPDPPWQGRQAIIFRLAALFLEVAHDD
jgi:hypothetical protein